ncbi:unnamed protein product [Brassica rapa subsp. narinosa]
MNSVIKISNLSDVKPFKYAWRVRVKVVHTWKSNNLKNGYSLEMVLTDENIYQIFLCFDHWRVKFFSPKAFIMSKRDVALGVQGYGRSRLTEETKTSPVVRFQGGLPPKILFFQSISSSLPSVFLARTAQTVVKFSLKGEPESRSIDDYWRFWDTDWLRIRMNFGLFADRKELLRGCEIYIHS